MWRHYPRRRRPNVELRNLLHTTAFVPAMTSRPGGTVTRIAALALGVAAAATAAVGAAAAPNRTLSISASPNPVVFGHTTVVSGNLTGSHPSGRTVSLRADPFPYDHFTSVATTTTDSGGHYTFAQTPSVNTRYQTRSIQGTASPILTELVRLRVSLRVSDSTPRVGQRVRFFGRACPANNGGLAKIQRFTRARHWRTVGLTHLVPSTGGCSKYSKRLRVFHSGLIRTLAAADPAHARGISRSRRLTVH
jgi:hypothetical protein